MTELKEIKVQEKEDATQKAQEEEPVSFMQLNKVCATVVIKH